MQVSAYRFGMPSAAHIVVPGERRGDSPALGYEPGGVYTGMTRKADASFIRARSQMNIERAPRTQEDLPCR